MDINNPGGDNGKHKPKPIDDKDKSRINTPKKVLLQVSLNAQGQVELHTSLPKEQAMNLCIDMLKMMHNSEEPKSRILRPFGR